MTVLYNTNFTHNANSYLTLAIEDAARSLFGADNVVLADNRSLLSLAASGRHDTLICIDGQRLSLGMIQRARLAFKTQILWVFEDPFMTNYNVKNMDLFDFVFTNDPSCAQFYGDKGHYLPLAASHKLHYRPVKPDAELDYDIYFAGTMWPNRISVLRQLIAAYPKARLKLVCPTNDYLPPLHSDLAQLAIHWPISHEAFIDFANASRVTITLFRDYASHGDVSQATAPGPRLYELGLSGTAQVVECGEDIDAKHFATAKGVAVTRSTDELIHNVGQLLANPAVRAEQAKTAQKSMEDHHLYEYRLRHISDVSHASFNVSLQATAPRPTRKLRVLMCTHSTVHENEWGGVEVYQETLRAMFKNQVDIFFWLRRHDKCRLIDTNGTELECFNGPEIGWLDSLTNSFEEVAFSNVVGQYDFDLVHFQHLGHHTASLPMVAKATGVGTIFSVHDFFLVCSRYNLLNDAQVFCDIGNKSISACNVCLKSSEKIPAGAQQTRRSFINEMIKSLDVLLFGSPYSETLCLQIYPELHKIRRAVLGIPTPVATIPESAPIVEKTEDARMVIAIVGNFISTKGADAVISVIEEANPDLFRFHLLGNATAEYIDELNRLNKPNVVYHGRYDPGNLSSIAHADVALLLSIWPETYSIALSEIWQIGLIPIVSDIGALGDRVVNGVNGFKVKVGDISAVLDSLELLRASAETRQHIRANIGPHLWVDYHEYADSLLKIYRSVAPAKPLGNGSLNFDAGQIHLLPHSNWKFQAPPRHIFDPMRDVSVRLELPQGVSDWNSIQGSEGKIDAVCGINSDKLGLETFAPADEFHIRGWTFVPNMGISGQVYVTLIGEGDAPVIFISATRSIRADVVSLHPAAPLRCGYLVRIALRGKWSDGGYRIAIVNTLGNKAAFQLTDLSIEMYAGQVVNASFSGWDTSDVKAAFAKVSNQTAGEKLVRREPFPARSGGQAIQRPWASDKRVAQAIETMASKSGMEMPATASLANTVPLFRQAPFWKRLRSPIWKWWRKKYHPLFDPSFYIEKYPDVMKAGVDPYIHYLEYGISEMRNPNAYFDTAWYLAKNPDARREFVDPLDHYLQEGAKRGLDPGPHFSTMGYLLLYADVEKYGMNPLQHFLQKGRFEGRVAEGTMPKSR